MPEFDAHASIRRLAEVEGVCPKVLYWEKMGMAEAMPEANHTNDCPDCAGTGRIVLFPALRTPCRNSTRPLLALEGELDDPVAEQRHQELFHRERCPCEGKYWVPELDAERVCWRLAVLRYQQPGGLSRLVYDRAANYWVWWDTIGKVHTAHSAVEAEIAVAEAWAEEQIWP